MKAGIRSIAQTPDGYLWLATELGLVRFDGVRFVPWSPPSGQRLPNTNLRSLVAARDGTLWIGTLEGLASWKDGKLTLYTEIAGQNVLSLWEDRDGTIWAGTFGVPKARLCAIQAGRVECSGEDGRFGQWVWALYQDNQGRLWVGAETGLWQWKPGPPKRYSLPQSIDTSQALVQGENQALLLAIGDGLWQFVDGKTRQLPLARSRGGLMTPVNLVRDRNGGLWIGSLQRGLLRLNQGQPSAFSESDGLSGNRVLSMFEDREGNMWVGTLDGLDRFREPTVFSISMKQGLSSPSVWSVLAARDNSVWVSTQDGVNRWKDGHVTIYRSRGSQKNQSPSQATYQPTPASDRVGVEPAVIEIADPGLPEDNAGSLAEDDHGRIWVSTPAGIARFESGKFTRVREVPGGWVNAITADEKGGVWISYQDKGLVHWVDGKVVERVPWSKLGGDVIASSVIPDPVRGGLWLGFFKGGLAYFKDGQVRALYGKKEGLGNGRVMGLQVDPDGVLWAATEGGLSRLKDGRVATLTSANGLHCDPVHWAMEDNTSSFWLYTACDLLRVSRAELEKWSSDPKHTIEFTTFDSSDGVRIQALLTGYTPRASKSADGNLWFVHYGSVSVIDPHKLRANPLPPPVHIEQVIADYKPRDTKNGMRLPPQVRSVAIDYTALSLVAPEKVRFRYKLEGQNRNWHEVVNDREVQYTNLAPGTYRFRVLACNNSGVWNEDGATLVFVVPPMWYQTNWFRLACVVAFLAVIWAGYQLRVRQLAYQFNLTLEAGVAERTRIARDLHDTLLQSFHGLLLRFQTVAALLPHRPVEAKEKLESAIDQAASAITEGRDAVEGLRSSTLQRDDLVLALTRLGRELADQAGDAAPVFRVEVEGTPSSLNPILREEVYRIAAEALRNAFHHALPRQVEAGIRYDEKQFTVHVRDDGRGIDPQILSHDGPQRHFGLHGMKERAKLLGGELVVWSESNAGTEVELRIPAAMAYEGSRRPWWAGKFSRKKAVSEKIES